MSGTLAYFDCFSGASGDMLLGALVDAGLPLDTLAADIALLGCPGIHLRAEKVLRAGISATLVHVETHDEQHHGHGHTHHHEHRGLPEIRAIITASGLPPSVKEKAIRIFTRLGEAEAAVHNVPIERIHFHEVGALDAIADIVGAVAGLERLGVESLLFSTLRLGGGTVQAGHGTLPVPAPATARLIAGLRSEMGPVEKELLTPTAAAILSTLGRQAPPPAWTIEKLGYGAGMRDHPGHPNVLRLLLGRAETGAESDTVWVLEANLDDTTAEVIGHTIERLLAAGALDAYALPIQMKKSRPGWMLCAIVEEPRRLRAEELFFRETTTFGVRRHLTERQKLTREICTVETPYGPVRVKVGALRGEVVNAAPEYDDCRRIALERDIPLREVMAQARKAFAAR